MATPRNEIAYKQSSYRGAKAVTPSDSADLANPVSALYVETSGNLALNMANGDEITLTAVPAKTVLPLAVARVKSTGTTATGIIGLE